MKYVLLLVVICLSSHMGRSQQAPHFPGELLIQLKPTAAAHEVEGNFVDQFGILPELKADRCVSAHMRIWLFTFNEEAVPAAEMLRMLGVVNGVGIAQLNHQISNRDTTPDDPFFANQWHHHDPQDNDIDSDLAWDITTGGFTATGDEIVACVVETGGASWNHIDLVDNHWVNENEIPDNGIDDDNNGYIDDYDGWNINSDSDNISGGNHGTQVSSMIGSTGNNATGVTGVNWNVKLMEVQLGSISEASVIEAYTYPLVMRKKYNETNGELGAFVVVTNSSWGIDNGQPEDAPLWCAMYDSLGTYGILSCGATANNNVNIDVVGDLPTACPSEYMIAVTATDNNDIRDFSGYGITTIDLGAPGKSVYLASNTNNYANATGTSFASPCVAGAAALLYSAPCFSLMSLVYADPGAGALAIRDYLFNGVDELFNLSTEVATGGRLNVNNSLLLLLDECNTGGCVAPFQVGLEQLVGTMNYSLTWGITEEMNYFTVRYRPVGDTDWIEVFDIFNNSYVLTNLLTCTEYEAQVMAFCDSGESNWSNNLVWTTDGCCTNPLVSSIIVSEIQPNGFSMIWDAVTASINYVVVITDSEGGQTEYNTTTNFITISGLEPCSAYVISVQTECDELESTEPEEFGINTPGCVDCSGQEYCDITGNSNAEWIARVQLNSIDNITVADGGYGDYTDISTTLDVGATYPIVLTPGFAAASFSEYFKVWIDLNVNGSFEENELMYDAGGTTNSAITGSVFVPWNAIEGATRMRVGMSWVGALGGGGEPVFCGDNTYGETEDYCIYINTDVGTKELGSEDFLAYPNPTSDQLYLNNPWPCTVQLLDATGQVALSKNCTTANGDLRLEGVAPGIYILHVRSGAASHRQRIVIQ